MHALARRLAAVTPGLSYTCITDELSDDAVVNSAVAGSDRVINCLDEGHLARAYRLNRICLQLGTCWISGSSTGLEVRVWPLVVPRETACYMCYQMRLVACTQNPEEALRLQAYFDGRRQRARESCRGARQSGAFPVATARAIVAAFSPEAAKDSNRCAARRSDIALRVLMLLAQKPVSGRMSVETLARELGGLSRNHLRKIVQELTAVGITRTVRGAVGGVTCYVWLGTASTVALMRIPSPTVILSSRQMTRSIEACIIDLLLRSRNSVAWARN